MRLLLAAIVICAGIGYAYNHQASLAVAKSDPPARPRLFDWNSADDTLAAVSDVADASDTEPPLVVRDTINATRHEVKSVLDEFVRVNGETNEAPREADIGATAAASATGTSTTTAQTAPPPDAAAPVNAASKDAAPTDIVSQAVSPADDSGSESELVPFASTEDDVVADSKPGPAPSTSSPDLISTDLTSTNPAPTNSTLAADRPTEVPSKPESIDPTSPKDSGSGAPQEIAKPSINEATLVTRQGPNQEVLVQPIAQPETRTTSQPRSKTELLPGGKPPAKGAIDDSKWTVIGKSVNQVSLHSRRLGRVGIRTLVIAGLDGQDLIATRWNDQLVGELLRQNELFQSNEIMVVRAGNPDGLMKKSTPNAHGVVINRNFPSRRYQFLTDKSAGPGPASEPETHAILDVMYKFRPRRVIHLTSTTGRSTISYNRAAKAMALDLQKQFQWDAVPLDVELVPGSVEDFSDGTLDAAVISLKLNVKSGAEWQQAWTRHQPALLAALDGHRVEKLFAVSDDLSQASPDQAGTRIPNSDEELPAVQKRRRGYEELPAPPR